MQISVTLRLAKFKGFGNLSSFDKVDDDGDDYEDNTDTFYA